MGRVETWSNKRLVAICEEGIATNNVAALICRVVADVMPSSCAQVKSSAIMVNLTATNACSHKHAP